MDIIVNTSNNRCCFAHRGRVYQLHYLEIKFKDDNEYFIIIKDNKTNITNFIYCLFDENLGFTVQYDKSLNLFVVALSFPNVLKYKKGIYSSIIEECM